MLEVMEAAAARVAAKREGRKDAVPAPDAVMVSTRRLIERESTVAGFMAARMERTGQHGDCVTLKASYEAYCEYCAKAEKPVEKKGVFKEEMQATLGDFGTISGNKKNYWRGWVLLKNEACDGGEEDDGLAGA